MNLNKFHLLVVLILVLSFASCNNEPLEGFDEQQQQEQDPNINAIFKATLSDSIDFNATEITAELTVDGLQFSGTMNNQRIGFNVANPTVGPKDLSSDEANGFYDANIQELISNFYTAQQGVLNIENIDSENNKISGVFSGDFEEISSNDTISITEGVFTDIVFEDNTTSNGQGDSINQASGGSLSVDIDGETTNFDLTENSFPNGQNVVVYSFSNSNDNNSTDIALVLPINLNEGSFDVNAYTEQSTPFNPYSFSYDLPSESTTFLSLANSGQVTIETVTESSVEGAFNFDGENLSGDQTSSFTNGSFTINFQ